MLPVMEAGPITLSHPVYLAICLAACALAAVVALARHAAISAGPRSLILTGMILLSFTAAEPQWRRPVAQEVVVRVDLSASTRSAEYRSKAKLDARLAALLGPVRRRIEYFADGVASPTADGDRLVDLPGTQTRYVHPSAAAVLLFSDGRFPPPSVGGPPTYPVLDPGLLHSADAAVESMELRGGEVASRIGNTGAPRPIRWTGASSAGPTTVPSGTTVQSRAVDPGAETITVALSPGDLWPENDALSIPGAAPMKAELWIVGAAAPSADWRAISAAELPVEPAPYLRPAVIVLFNVPAADLSTVVQERLQQYVRDLGGGLIITGGDRAFAAGGFAGSVIESLSPLASTPPEPTTHWMLLADASGSMNSAAGGGGGPTRWQYAVDALLKVLPLLPPDDIVSLGSFSDQTRWWSFGRPVKETLAKALPPAGVAPGGPTDLRPALDQMIERSEPAMQKQLLLLTDADADVGDVPKLINALRSKNIHLNLLAIEEGRGLPALREAIAATGGRVVRQDQAALWSRGIRDLMRQAAPSRLNESPLAVRFSPELNLPGRSVAAWNSTWLKKGATAIAIAEEPARPDRPAGLWNFGEGKVLAAGFAPKPAELSRFTAAAARTPADPRFTVTVDPGSVLRVLVDASGRNGPLNGESITIEMHPADGPSVTIPAMQIAPGRYEAWTQSPATGGFATVRNGPAVLKRFALSSRYTPEFDAIGVDRDLLRRLAEQTGGYVIDGSARTPIPFQWPTRETPLTPWAASAGALLIAVGLMWWRGS